MDLMKNGYIKRTPRGRVVTDKAYRHLGIENIKKTSGQIQLEIGE